MVLSLKRGIINSSSFSSKLINGGPYLGSEGLEKVAKLVSGGRRLLGT